MKVRDVIKYIEVDGRDRLPGKRTGHRQYKHPTKPGRVTISGSEGSDVPPGTLRSVLKQARVPDPRAKE